MIFDETYDYLFNKLAAPNDAQATLRAKDYQRKRLRRALLGRSLKPYFLEASWTNAAGTLGETNVASTQPVTRPLIVLDGAIRTTDVGAVPSADNNNFELRLFRTAGDSRVQISQDFIKDEHTLTPAQAAIRPAAGFLGQGALWPLTWPVPLRLRPNELIQVQSRVLTGGVPADETTFCQFRAVSTDNDAEDDSLVQNLKEWIAAHETQQPRYLSMFSENARSITFPATGAPGRTVAKTHEALEHLLVLGYAALFARGDNDEFGSTSNPKWRLQSSEGHSFSREEVDLNTYAYAGPGFFWQEFPRPFLLLKGSSLSASFSTLGNVLNAQEQIDNYVYFRCVTV